MTNPADQTDGQPAGATGTGIAILFTAAALIGLFPIVTRLASPSFTPTGQTFLRFGTAATVLAIIAVRRGKSFRLTRRDLELMIAVGALSFALGLFLAIAATHTTPGTTITVLFGTSVITATGGGLIMGEPIRWSRACGIVLALAGLVIYTHHLNGSGLGIATAAAAGASDGTCNTIRRRVRHVDATIAVIYQYGIGAVLAAAAVALTGDPLITSVRTGPLAAMLTYTAATMLLGGLLFTGFARVHLSVGAVILATQVLFTVLASMLVLRQMPHAREMTGVPLVITAALVSLLPTSRNRAIDGLDRRTHTPVTSAHPPTSGRWALCRF